MITSVRQTTRYVPSDHDRDAAANAVRDARAADPPDLARIKRAEEHAARVDANLAQCGDHPPTYLIKPAALYEREEFEAALAAKGVLGYPNNRDLAAAARRVIADLAPDNAAAMLAICDEWEGLPPVLAGIDQALLDQIADLEILLSVHPVMGLRIGARRKYLAMMPLVAAQRFLVGWENVEVPFVRRGGIVPDETLEALPREHLVECGWRAWSLMYLKESDRGNSPSPRPLLGVREPSTETSPPTAAAAG